jgi:hypothetical protein
VIGDFLLNEIGVAIELVAETKLAHPPMKQILEMLGTAQQLPFKALVSKNLKRPVPDTVLQKVERDGERVLVPATNAIGIVLQQNLTR